MNGFAAKNLTLIAALLSLTVACSLQADGALSENSAAAQLCDWQTKDGTDLPVLLAHGFADTPGNFRSISTALGLECSYCKAFVGELTDETLAGIDSSCPADNRLHLAECCSNANRQGQAIYTPRLQGLEGTEARGRCLAAHARAASELYGPPPDNDARVHCTGHSQGGQDCVWLSQEQPEHVASVSTFNAPFAGSLGTNLARAEYIKGLIDVLGSIFLGGTLEGLKNAAQALARDFTVADQPEIFSQHFASYTLPRPTAYYYYENSARPSNRNPGVRSRVM